MSDLNRRLDAIAKKWGEDTVVRFGDIEQKKVEVISSGCLAIDVASQVGGYPRGAITELFGPESGGKTTLALWFLAHVQTSGGIAVYVNTEQKQDPGYIRSLFETYGGNQDELLISRPPCGEAALDIVENMIDVADAVALDSVADLITLAEINADDTRDNFVGMQARLVTKSLKRIKPKLGLSKTVLLFVNQLRANIGGYGSSETTGGGRALRHACVLRLRVSLAGAAIKNRGVEIGIPCKAKVRKNQVGKPGSVAEFNIIWGKGLDQARDVFEAALATGVIERAGSVYRYRWDGDGVTSVSGKVGSINRVKETPGLVERIREQVLGVMNGERDTTES